MTSITYWKTDDSFYLHVTGHAGFADAGADIVCAAISILMNTLGHRIDALTDDYDLNYAVGNACVTAHGKKAVEAFETIFEGLNLVLQAYPDYVKIERIGVTYDDDE